MAAGFPSCRLVLALMGFFGFINCYTLRVNLSVAIVAMVNTTYLRELEAAAADHDDANVSVVDACAVDGNETTHVVHDTVRIEQTQRSFTASTIDVKNVQIKIKKREKRDKKTFVNVIENVTSS